MKRVLWIIILVAVLASLGLFAERWVIERPNRTVEIVYDMPGLLELSQVSSHSLDKLFLDLKAAGVLTIAVQPESVGDYLLQNRALPSDILTQLPKQVVDLGKVLPLSVSYDPTHFAALKVAGLQGAPKLNTVPWDVDPVWLVDQPNLVIVSGQGAFSLTQLRDSEAVLALVEFSTPQIPQAKASNMVRLHGISAPEMLVLSDDRILNRYVRAVRERNIRVLYVRPFVEGDQSWERSLQLLENLEKRLSSAGFSLGTAVPFAAWAPSTLWSIAAGAGIWAGAILLGFIIFPGLSKLLLGGGVLAYLGSLVLLMVSPTLIQQGLALLAAIVFPCLAVQVRVGKKPFWQYWSAALISMCGAVFVVSLLSGTEFLIKLQEFRGVKLMHVVPIAVVLYTLLRPLRAWLKKEIPVTLILGAGIIGLAGVLYILRTGNFGIGVPKIEVQIREFLENLLRTRPRTKEFMVGHPAFYLSLHSKEPGKSWWLPIAVIGQISLVNTFTHTHTFLWVSLLRTIYGLVFGYALGWLATKVYAWGKMCFRGTEAKA